MTAEGLLTPGRRESAALAAARMYYLQDLTMEAIARELDTSRSTVSRLISHARATGLVDIRVRAPLELRSGLEAALSDRFGIDVHIVPIPDRNSDVERLERVALSAARLLNGFLESDMVLGLAWGSTTNALSRHLVPKSTDNTHVVQLNGAGNSRTTGLTYASEILRRFGEAYGAQVHQFAVPAFFDDPATKLAMWRERSTRLVLDMQERVDIAVFGLGSPFAEVPSRVYMGGYLDEGDYASLSDAEVVGDIATVFYRLDGSHDGIRLNARSTGPAPELLRGIRRRFCVVAGRAKLDSLRGALAGGFVTDLVVDEGTARELAAS